MPSTQRPAQQTHTYFRLPSFVPLTAEEDDSHLKDEDDVFEVCGLLHFTQVVGHVTPLYRAVHLQVAH